MMLRLLVTGSRTWDNAGYVWDVLDRLLVEHDGMILLHGACPTGADQHADRWARQRMAEGARLLVDPFPANWGAYGRAAGTRRNAEMVAALGAATAGVRVACHGFVGPGEARGTRHCLKLARRAGVPTVVHRYDQLGVAE